MRALPPIGFDARLAARPGVVHWITGLPCAGKTTVGEALVRRMRSASIDVVLLDGDVLRRVFPVPLGYSRRDRLAAASCYSRLSLRFALRGRHVVVCTVSMYAEVWRWNRVNLPRYVEVLLVADPSVRESRDDRGIYDGSEVPGRDLAVDDPVDADLRLVNDGSHPPERIAERIWAASPLSEHGT